MGFFEVDCILSCDGSFFSLEDVKLERSVDREQTTLSPANSRSLKIVLLIDCYDRARFSLIQLF